MIWSLAVSLWRSGGGGYFDRIHRWSGKDGHPCELGAPKRAVQRICTVTGPAGYAASALWLVWRSSKKFVEIFLPTTVLVLSFIMGLQNAMVTKTSNAEIEAKELKLCR